jgi:hypothetical protein
MSNWAKRCVRNMQNDAYLKPTDLWFDGKLGSARNVHEGCKFS